MTLPYDPRPTPEATGRVSAVRLTGLASRIRRLETAAAACRTMPGACDALREGAARGLELHAQEMRRLYTSLSARAQK